MTHKRRSWTDRRKPWRGLGAVTAGVVLLGLLAGCNGQTWLPGTAAALDGTRAAGRPGPARRSQVAEAQTMLSRLGYYTAPVDGIDGPMTRRAVRDYQAGAGLPENGEISPTLLARLNASLGAEPMATGAIAVGAPTWLPRYEPGTTFVYSDDSVERVVAVDGERVRWQTDDGVMFSRYRNFILPRLSWTAEDGQGESVVDASPDALWPLARGNEVSFSVRTQVRFDERPDNVSTTSESWRCKVEATPRISVVAGTFDTLKVVCDRTTRDPAPKLKRVWYYAPLVGHFVRMNDFYDAVEQDRHVELVTVRPEGQGWPPAARAGLSWALEHALHKMTPGEQIVWSSSAVDTRVTIQPQRRFERGDRRQCRNFLQTWSTAGRQRSFPGTACLDAAGRWRLPGLGGGDGMAIAVSSKAS